MINHTPYHSCFIDLTGHSQAGSWSLLVPLTAYCSDTTYKGRMIMCIIMCDYPFLWQQFGDRLHIGVTVRCPQTLAKLYTFKKWA